MAASEDNFTLKIFLNGCFSKTAAKYIYFKNSRLHIFYISYFDVMLKRNKFLWIFFKFRFRQKVYAKRISFKFHSKTVF